MFVVSRVALSWFGLTILCVTMLGCGGAPTNSDPKTLAEEAEKLDKHNAEGEKGL